MKDRKPPKKKVNFGLVGAVIIGGLIIGISIFYFYTAEQAQIRGQNFGVQLDQIQKDLKNEQEKFRSDVKIFQEGDFTKEELTTKADLHFEKLDEITKRYDDLWIPDGFKPSVDLFKMSTISQLESDKLFIDSVLNDDEYSLIRSDELLQESFELEMAALSSFNTAKKGIKP